MKSISLILFSLLIAPGMALAQQPTQPGWPQPMNNNPKMGYTIFNQNEMRMRNGNHTWRWESDSWYGGNINRIAVKTEGNLDTDTGKFDEAEIQVLASRAVSRYFNLQVGGRYNFQPKPSRKWAVVGVEGLAPFFWDLSAWAYIGPNGRTSARLEASYDMRFTQRLILQPQFELNFYSRREPARGLGSGLAEIDSGLRLRYEITREFAPYIGITYSKKYGQTADIASSAGDTTEQLQFAAGVRFWF